MAGHILGTLELPRGMVWIDEMDWIPVLRTKERGITGHNIIDEYEVVEGRLITLHGIEDGGWIRRGTLLALQQLAAVAGAVYPLTLADGRQFFVSFAPDSPIKARTLHRPELPKLTELYIATVALITVEEPIP